MSLSVALFSLLLTTTLLIFMQNLAIDAACSDCFVPSRASQYKNSKEHGTDVGACGFGSFGATVNGGNVSAASNLYRDGLGCGACYQVICTREQCLLLRRRSDDSDNGPGFRS
ncbi:hypothetical protein QN277_003421 [Acacia crassicarpa]|uniref:Expansin-like EG45 domain-containing protein n=1 Tax=Acacia crassicarpa TaxID=499986 RepID=A0AAE1J0A1_9FABA|nr:hypothetical protein QN277_003421 [Acacia crassicarpa]